MFVLVALIHMLVEKRVISYDEVKAMFMDLEDTIRLADAEGTEKELPLDMIRRFQKILNL